MLQVFTHNVYSKVIVLFGAVLIVTSIAVFSDTTQNDIVAEVQPEVIKKIDMFQDLSLEAKAVFVWDVNKQQALYQFNGETQLPLASLTKLATAVTALEILPEQSVVTIDAESLSVEGDSGLLENEKWDFKDLIRYTLVVSSNDGASALANVAGIFENDFTKKETENRRSFVSAMNSKVKNIGLTQTYFINPTGLDSNELIGGGYGSAHDMARLLEYAIAYSEDVVEATRHSKLEFASLSDILHPAINTNSSVSAIPGLIASKTGFTDLAGGNLVVAFDAGLQRPIVISILGSTKEGRFRDVEKLVTASLESL